MNKLPENLLKGTFGELLVQIRLLQYEIQAAPPIKDSGNDLIAISYECFKAIQVKTTGSFPVKFNKKTLPANYHILALVVLENIVEENSVHFDIKLDSCQIFLLEKAEVTKSQFQERELEEYKLNKDRINKLFYRKDIKNVEFHQE